MFSAFRYPAIVFVAIFALAACGGPTGTTGTLPQANGTQASLSKDAYSGDLLYVTYPGQSVVEVFTYPKGQLVQTLSVGSPAYSICSDSSGNVFIPTWSGNVYGYAHGAKKPKVTLSIPGSDERASACAVDPLTDNLAVEFYPLGSGFYGVAVFPNESGTATLYNNKFWASSWDFISYDDSSDLFMSGATDFQRVAMWELPAGGSQPLAVNILNGQFWSVGQVQWDGKYITLADTLYDTISRFTFSTQGVSRPGYINGTVVGVTTFDKCDYRSVGQSWIQGSALIVPCAGPAGHYGVHGYAYPQGGEPSQHLLKAARRLVGGPFYGVTISVAPSETRIHR